MRAVLGVLIIGLLAATPTFAKSKPNASDSVPRAVEFLEVCEKFASGDVLVVEWASELGWDAKEGDSGSLYARLYNANRYIEGVGDVALVALIEDYPTQTLGYCRIDIVAPAGTIGVLNLNELPRLTGTIRTTSDTDYGSWEGAESGRDYLLLASQDPNNFSLQLTTFVAHAAQNP